MPWLARQKRRLIRGYRQCVVTRGRRGTIRLVGYMAWIALAGLILTAIWSIGWADPRCRWF